MKLKKFKNLMAPFYSLGSTVSRPQSHREETVFINQFPRVSGTQKTELTMELPSCFEPETPGLRIQRFSC